MLSRKRTKKHIKREVPSAICNRGLPKLTNQKSIFYPLRDLFEEALPFEELELFLLVLLEAVFDFLLEELRCVALGAVERSVLELFARLLEDGLEFPLDVFLSFLVATPLELPLDVFLSFLVATPLEFPLDVFLSFLVATPLDVFLSFLAAIPLELLLVEALLKRVLLRSTLSRRPLLWATRPFEGRLKSRLEL